MQSNLALGSRYRCKHANCGKESRVGLVTVPLDRALLCSYRLSIVTIPLSVTVWQQYAMGILTQGFMIPKYIQEWQVRIKGKLDNPNLPANGY